MLKRLTYWECGRLARNEREARTLFFEAENLALDGAMFGLVP
jgi:hypothetical protein